MSLRICWVTDSPSEVSVCSSRRSRLPLRLLELDRSPSCRPAGGAVTRGRLPGRPGSRTAPAPRPPGSGPSRRGGGRPSSGLLGPAPVPAGGGLPPPALHPPPRSGGGAGAKASAPQSPTRVAATRPRPPRCGGHTPPPGAREPAPAPPRPALTSLPLPLVLQLLLLLLHAEGLLPRHGPRPAAQLPPPPPTPLAGRPAGARDPRRGGAGR